jgi:hypothetical protein
VKQNRLTVASIAALAFILADIAHETIGHGIGFFLAGGHHGIFTTTRLLETQRLGDRGGDIFDMGGPFGNLLCAAIAWLALRFVSQMDFSLRLFFSLTLAFSLFWALGYLAFCGITAKGDWYALIRAVPSQAIWRIIFVLVGTSLYLASMRLASTQFPWTSQTLIVCYLSGGAMGILGALLDPRGWPAIRHDGLLSGFASAIGLLALRTQKPANLPRSPVWIITAVAVCLFYIFILGPGIKF